MKTLDLNNYGVQEMNALEKRITDGGAWLPAVIVWCGIYIATEVLGNPTAHINAFNKGWDAAK